MQITSIDNLREMIRTIHANFDKFTPSEDICLDSQMYNVVWLMDRQKPSVEQCYDFDEERLGVARSFDGKKSCVIVGTDSGCSCPSPWHDNFPDCYTICKTYTETKEFALKNFDEDWADVCLEEGMKILNALQLKYKKRDETLSEIGIAFGSALGRYFTLAETKAIVDDLDKLGFSIRKP